MSQVTSKEEARKVLVEWIRAQRWTGKIVVSIDYGLRQGKLGNYYDFDLAEPYGVFHVYESGTVVDSYQTLVE